MLSNHYQPIRPVSASYISGVAHFSGIITHNIYLIKGGLICQKNVGTATFRWGGTYMLVNTVERTQKIEDVPVLLRAFEDIRKPRYEIV
jgi:hypothetical protein